MQAGIWMQAKILVVNWDFVMQPKILGYGLTESSVKEGEEGGTLMWVNADCLYGRAVVVLS